MDGVTRTEKVASVRKAKGKQWSGREAVNLWKRSGTNVGQGKPMAQAGGELWTQSLRGQIEVEAWGESNG